jgi:DNA helicase HerA-like ATPase
VQVRLVEHGVTGAVPEQPPTEAVAPGPTAPDRAVEYRDVRRLLEEAVQPFATSIDGKEFELQAPLHDLSFKVGGYVVVDTAHGPFLGQVLTLELGHLDSAEFTLSLEGEEGSLRAPVAVRAARGTGVILTGPALPFLDADVRLADAGAIHGWLEGARPKHAALEVGTLALSPDHPARLDAGGFGRHTFLCGQSGSGKTYSLGLVLERLLSDTTLRVIILDPNSDYVRLSTIRADAPAAEASRYRSVVDGIEVLRAASTGERPLRLRFAELEAACQAALLQLDPVADREEYAALLGVLEQDTGGRPLVGDFAGLEGEGAHQLGRRAVNLGLDKLDIWEAGQGGSLVDMIADDDWRCLVVDLGSVGSQDGQAVVTNSVLSTLWRLRARRQPVLVVIDEAHNVCPARPVGRLSELATRQTIQIAAEGRKFGLHLLISTQRPQKVHENVVSQCDNLVLMRMNSAADLSHLATLFSFVPAGLLAQSTGFGLGEALVAGPIAPQPTLIHFGRRITEEGGGDVSKDWAGPTRSA